jgi:hypothetical protein
MNISLDQYLTGLERTARELPGLLASWNTIDTELAEEYVDQLIWIISSTCVALTMAVADGRAAEAKRRIDAALGVISEMGDEIHRTMAVALMANDA